MQSDGYIKLSNWMFNPVEENLTNIVLDSFEQHNDMSMSVVINSQEIHDDNF